MKTISKSKLTLNIFKMQEQYTALEAEYAALKERYVKLETEKVASMAPDSKSQASNNNTTNKRGITVRKIQ